MREFPSAEVIGPIVKAGSNYAYSQKIVCCNGIVYHLVDHFEGSCARECVAYETVTGNEIADAHDMIAVPMSIARNLLENAKR